MKFEIKNGILEKYIPEQNETSVTVPDGVAQIGMNAFEECISLQEIALPDSVTEIGTKAFCHCRSLRKIRIPAGTTVIGENVFAGCESLEEIELPEHLERIGSFAFSGCRALREIRFPAQTVLGDRQMSVFFGCSALRKVVLPEGVKSLGSGFFCECESLEKIELPEGLQSLGEMAFSECTALREITLPDSLEEIGDRAFEECRALQEIRLPDGLKRIGAHAFCSCRKLKKVRFPADPERIPDNAFLLCPRLAELAFAAAPKQGSALHKWLCRFLPKHREISLNMQRLQTLDAESAAFLHASQTLEEEEITALTPKNPVMRGQNTLITVTIENNEFKFHGTFDCGYAGFYCDDQIFSNGDPDYVRENGLQGKDLSECSDEELAAEMAAFYNAIEARLHQNIQEFNGKFLKELMDDLEGCGYPYWEYPDMVPQAFLEANPDFDDWYPDDESELPEPVFIPENAGSKEIELRRKYPGFNFEHCISTLTLHGLQVSDMEDGGWISFEISDEMEYLCHLVAVVRPDLSFSDWNNG